MLDRSRQFFSPRDIALITATILAFVAAACIWSDMDAAASFGVLPFGVNAVGPIFWQLLRSDYAAHLCALMAAMCLVVYFAVGHKLE